jgi:hypothetical protein
MDKKTITAIVVSAALTFLVSAFIGYFMGVFERGSDALTEDQIKSVLAIALVTDEGKTYAQTLVSINTRLTTIEANQLNMQKADDRMIAALDILLAE